jgi:DNA-binding transcriptional LysR family regulator
LDIVDERADMMVKIGETLRMAALSGLSIIMQPEILLAEDLKNGNLRALLSNFAPEPKFVPLLTLPGRQQTPKVRTFIDFLRSRFPVRKTR